MPPFKIGLDFHGVIDADPDLFVKLADEMRCFGCEIHIITGNPWSKEILNELKSMDGGRIWWDHYFSIDDHLRKLGLPFFIDQRGGRVYDELSWNRTKAEYCRNEGIGIHVDDSAEYARYFTTPVLRYAGQSSDELKTVILKLLECSYRSQG